MKSLPAWKSLAVNLDQVVISPCSSLACQSHIWPLILKEINYLRSRKTITRSSMVV